MDVHFGPRTEVTEDRSDHRLKWMYPNYGHELCFLPTLYIILAHLLHSNRKCQHSKSSLVMILKTGHINFL